MPALNFKRRFGEAVRSGQKRQTIRAPRKDNRDPQAGETLYLYEGLRTRGVRVLGVTTCETARSIQINATGGCWIEGKELNETQRDIVAIADGFEQWSELVEFFKQTHGLPFDGFVYTWGELRRAGQR